MELEHRAAEARRVPRMRGDDGAASRRSAAPPSRRPAAVRRSRAARACARRPHRARVTPHGPIATRSLPGTISAPARPARAPSRHAEHRDNPCRRARRARRAGARRRPRRRAGGGRRVAAGPGAAHRPDARIVAAGSRGQRATSSTAAPDPNQRHIQCARSDGEATRTPRPASPAAIVARHASEAAAVDGVRVIGHARASRGAIAIIRAPRIPIRVNPRLDLTRPYPFERLRRCSRASTPARGSRADQPVDRRTAPSDAALRARRARRRRRGTRRIIP